MKKRVFEKHPCFWAENGDICVFGLKTRVKNCANEPKIVQKTQKRTRNDVI
jgi:hypothetical protein